jgi:ligand-binding SRPBCC domain-containing protein
MKIYRFYVEQNLPVDKNVAWIFFSDPRNLAKITPPGMNFTITNNPEDNIYSGMIITYKISPLTFFPMNWVTEIISEDKPNYFIDEQRFGPYKFWHHRHSFREIPNGTLMKDEVQYALPLGVIGRTMHYLFVKNKLKQIFTYRKEILKGMFNEAENTLTI